MKSVLICLCFLVIHFPFPGPDNIQAGGRAGHPPQPQQERAYITGLVTERGTGFPAGGVIVRWKGTSHSVITMGDGTYRIPVIPGAGKLVFSKPGWKDRTVRICRKGKVDIRLMKMKTPFAPAQPDEDLPPDSLSPGPGLPSSGY